MAVAFQQTDATSACALDAYCSGNSDNADEESNQAQVGGTPGTTARTIDADISAADLNAVWMEIINIDDYDGASGNWTVRLNITTANHQLSVDEIHICRINSSCTNQETLASSTAIARALGTAQEESFTVNQSAGTTITAGDKIMVIFAIDNAQSMPQAFGYTPDSIITGPGTITGAGLGIPIAFYHLNHHNWS